MTRAPFQRRARSQRPRAASVRSCQPVFRASLAAEPLEQRVMLAVFTVTTTADDGPGSLREAITLSNVSPSLDDIRFNIAPPNFLHTITPLTPLPAMTGQTRIDGRTQQGSANRPMIELNGSAAGPFADGLVFTSMVGPNLVRGLVINRFGRHGISTVGRASLAVEFSYIGTDATGQLDRGNGGAGIALQGPAFIGGPKSTSPQNSLGNVISGNDFAGIWSSNPSGSAGVLIDIAGNFIGTDATGARPLGNGREGVLIEGAIARIGRPSTGSSVSYANVISGNGSSGIRIMGPSTGTTTIEGNLIGTDATGSRAVPNGTAPLLPYHDGITSFGVNALRIGGTATGSRNVISGNVGGGISIRRGMSPIIQGNYIGTDATGNADVGNGGHGVSAASIGSELRVMGNVISGNDGDGLHAEGAASTPGSFNVTIGGNYVGTNNTGTGAIGNGGDGIDLSGALRGTLGGTVSTPPRPGPFEPAPLPPTSTGRNVISANGGSGVSLAGLAPISGGSASPIQVAVVGNYIGTNVNGNADLGNGGDGITAHRSASAVNGNLVSGNGGNGIRILNSTANTRTPTVAGNYVGTNAAGTAAIGNDGHGIELRSSTGVGVGGSQPNPTIPPVIQPLGTGRNIISGNRGHGVFITGEPLQVGPVPRGHLIASNYIGTDVTGSIALGNAGSGIFATTGGHGIGGFVSSGDGNVISANAENGITVVGTVGTGSTAPGGASGVFANRIGTNAAGSDDVTHLGNGGHGIAIFNARNNAIGDTARGGRGRGNTIAFNAGNGVHVEGAPGASTGSTTGSADGNLIAHNSIFANGKLGIDLVFGYEGVTPNDLRDPDVGPNRLQNFPVLTRVTAPPPGSTSTTFRFTLNSEPSRAYRIDFYSSPAPDPSGFGEGKTYLGTVSVTTDASGNASSSGDVRLSVALDVGTYVTATATQTTLPATGGTSEFSAPLQVVSANEPASVEGRYVFYNQSAYDGGSSGATEADDAAIATDKQALLPGQGPATSANYTSYTRGLNGVMVDVAGLVQPPAPSDFTFRTGRERSDGTIVWSEGPLPTAVTVRRGAGVNGSDRITLLWPAYSPSAPAGVRQAVGNGWLEVTMLPTTRTNLALPDVFYFGNLWGDTARGDAAGATHARVNALDLAAARAQPSVQPAGIASGFDFNRDGAVNAADRAAVRANLFRTLRLIVAPPQPPLATDPPLRGADPAVMIDPQAASQEEQTASVWSQVAR